MTPTQNTTTPTYTPGGGYRIHRHAANLTVKPRPNDFRRGVQEAKKFGGTFDRDARTWTVPVYETEEGILSPSTVEPGHEDAALGWIVIARTRWPE